MRRYCRTRGKPLWTRANHTHQNPWQITRANNTTHLYNPTLPTKSPPIFTPFFFLVVCVVKPPCALSKGQPFFFLGGCQPPASLKHLPYKKGCRENDYRYDACSGVLIGLSDNQWRGSTRGFSRKKPMGVVNVTADENEKENDVKRKWQTSWTKRKKIDDGWME